MRTSREFRCDMNKRRRSVDYLKRLNVEVTEDNICRLVQMEDEVRDEILETIVHIVTPIITSILTALIVSSVLIH